MFQGCYRIVLIFYHQLHNVQLELMACQNNNLHTVFQCTRLKKTYQVAQPFGQNILYNYKRARRGNKKKITEIHKQTLATVCCHVK